MKQRIIGLLAVTQIVSWGSLYYGFTVLAPQIAASLGWQQGTVFGAFSWSLLVGAFASPGAGILLDRWGGRAIMAAGSACAAAGFAMLSNAHSVMLYYAAWTVLGVAMALTLYEAAFATINREFDTDPRRGMSTLTLFGGLASTVFWPLTAALSAATGWRDACLVFAAMHLVVCLPLHLLLPARGSKATNPRHTGHTLAEALRHPVFWMLTLAFSMNAFIFSAMSAHLFTILAGSTQPGAAVLLLTAMIGPLQVAGRLMERWFGENVSPVALGRIVFGMLPAAFGALLVFGQSVTGIALFCVIYGLSNGVLTIVRGMVPQVVFGRSNYGAISGAMAGPTLVARAAGPLTLAWLLDGRPPALHAAAILAVCALLSLLAFWRALAHRGGSNANRLRAD